MKAFVRYANTGEVGRLVATYYAEDALVLPPNAPRVQGQSQIRELFQALVDEGAGDVTLDTSEVRADGDVGYGVGSGTYILRQPGSEPVHDRIKYVLVYRRQSNGSWKVAVDAWSSDFPAS